ncbi:hypothetical protein MLD38_014625 [Melastoma candidum]|uniref:Uncharacterized protein n=1 Tax=Melastoma candidum TaxID=119954 RepID=A0ACB9RCQ7_9MYRT|nr:hypothetical protein MLD38_014625 [Melastoma candidum]
MIRYEKAEAMAEFSWRLAVSVEVEFVNALVLCDRIVIFCEAVAIYGVIVAIILQTKLESVPQSLLYAPESLRAGDAIFASGIIVGFANLVCRLCVGIIGSSCALSDRQNSSLFLTILVIEIFGSAGKHNVSSSIITYESTIPVWSF